MKKNLNKGINYLMYCAGLLVTVTGFALAWKLKRGTELLGLNRHEWGDIHLWVGVVLAVAIVAHLVLHWRWIWQVASKRVPWVAWVGIAPPILACLVVLSLPLDRPNSSMATRTQELKPPTPSVEVPTDEDDRPHHSKHGKRRYRR